MPSTGTPMTTIRVRSTIGGTVEWTAVHDVQVPAEIATDVQAVHDYMSGTMIDGTAAWARGPAFNLDQAALDNNELGALQFVDPDTPLTKPHVTHGRLAHAYLDRSPAENATTYAVRLLEVSRLAAALPHPLHPKWFTVTVSRRPRRSVSPLLITGQSTTSFRDLGNTLTDWRGPDGETFTDLYTALHDHLTAALTDPATEPDTLGWERPEPSFLRLWGLAENAPRTWTVPLLDARTLTAVAALDQL